MGTLNVLGHFARVLIDCGATHFVISHTFAQMTQPHPTPLGFDLEFAYIDSYEDVMSLEEDLLIAGLTAVKEKYGKEIKDKFGVEVIIPTKPFPRIKLEELYKELEKEYGFKMNYEDVGDMNAETEKLRLGRRFNLPTLDDNNQFSVRGIVRKQLDNIFVPTKNSRVVLKKKLS